MSECLSTAILGFVCAFCLLVCINGVFKYCLLVCIKYVVKYCLLKYCLLVCIKCVIIILYIGVHNVYKSKHYIQPRTTLNCARPK